MLYQQMVLPSHSNYLRMFLAKGITVLTWNYRAYGRSSGNPTPANIREDVDTIYHYLREKLNIKSKIGIYGRSLGGIPASYLADKVDMAIIDRSFGSLADVARWQYRSGFAALLLKVGSCGWQS